MRFKWTLTKRIWLSFALLILLIGFILSLVYPFLIKSALREDSFDTIEYVQRTLYLGKGNYGFGGQSKDELTRQYAAKAVGNVVVNANFTQVDGNLIRQRAVYNKMVRQMMNQKTASRRYEMDYHGATLYYVISKIYTNIDSGYYISYMWDTYPNELMRKLWLRMIYILIVVGILSLFTAFWLARYLKRPLDILGNRFEEISRMNWEKPFEWKGDEEFERLSAQFEKMRLNLIKYDRSQKNFIQQASHELKTPIMVIHSYAQAIKDKIYPKGGLNESVDVIIDEADQMERRVKKMLYFTRYDSLKDRKTIRRLTRFGNLASEIRKRLSVQRRSIVIHISGEDIPVYGDREQLGTILENLVENGLRYANNNLWMRAEQAGGKTILSVENDGPMISADEQRTIFRPFEKGKKGQFGLGLAIVERIVKAHNGTVRAENRSDRVAFVITLPLPKKELDRRRDT